MSSRHIKVNQLQPQICRISDLIEFLFVWKQDLGRVLYEYVFHIGSWADDDFCQLEISYVAISFSS